MDLTAAAYLLIFLLSSAFLYRQVTKRISSYAAYLLTFLLFIAFLYNQATERIPSRLDPSQAPKLRFEFVRAGANDSPTRADGYE